MKKKAAKRITGEQAKSVRDELKRLGVEFRVFHQAKHFLFEIYPEKGTTFTVSAAKTASDWRGTKNVMSRIKRALRVRGCLGPDEEE